MKRELIKELITHDVERFKQQSESISSVLANSPLGVASIISRKCPNGNYTYLRTQEAWTRRVGAAKVEELQDALSYIKDGSLPSEKIKVELEEKQVPEETPMEDERNDFPDVSPAVIANILTKSEAFAANTTAPLSEIALMQHRKEEIAEWYSNALESLNVQKHSLREEQYRRRKAQLRVEYWAKMDKESNNVNPTVVNF